MGRISSLRSSFVMFAFIAEGDAQPSSAYFLWVLRMGVWGCGSGEARVVSDLKFKKPMSVSIDFDVLVDVHRHLLFAHV